ncbi:MAG: hypothetical protein Q4G68_12095 [Planctomycetia bacterium]|nr:hypothetical protein [Planctomycetia bacterium]
MILLETCKNNIFIKKRNFYFSYASILFSLFIWQLLWPSLTSAEIVWEDFKNDVMTSWDTILNEYRKGVEMEIYLIRPNVEEKIFLAFKEKMELEMYSSNTKNINNGGSLLDACNSKYQFTIERDSENSPWIIKKISNDISEKTKDSLYYNELLPLSHLFFAPFMIEEQWLTNIFQSDKVEIESIKQNNEVQSHIEVKFHCNDCFIDEHTKLLRGIIVFDSSNHYLINNYEAESEFTIPYAKPPKSPYKTIRLKRSSQFEYSMINGLPFVSYCETHYDEDPKIVDGFIKFPANNFEKIKYMITKTDKDVNGSLFYLSHYGFPEPEDTNRKYNLFRLLLAIIGVGLIGTGLYMRLKGINKTKTQL